MSLLSAKAGLPASAHTTDPDARFADIGLDSLAFLSMQTDAARPDYDTEMPDDSPDRYTLGEIARPPINDIRPEREPAGMA